MLLGVKIALKPPASSGAERADIGPRHLQRHLHPTRVLVRIETLPVAPTAGASTSPPGPSPAFPPLRPDPFISTVTGLTYLNSISI